MASKSHSVESEKTIADLSAIFNSIPDIACLKDCDGRYQFINPAFCKASGLTPKEVLGKTDFDIWPKDLASKYASDDRRVIENKRAVRIEEPFIHKGGLSFWFETIKAPVTSKDGGVVGVAIIARDFTAHRTVREELLYERTLLEAFMDNSVDYIFFKDLDSRFIRANRAWASAWGAEADHDPEKIKGMIDFDFFPKEVAQGFYDDERDIIRTGKPIFGKEEYGVPITTGRPAWVSTSKMPLRDRDGKIIGTFGVSRDITELKLAQKSLEEYKTNLENLVHERTAQLERDIVQRKMVEEQLRESQENLAITLSSIADAVISTTASGQVAQMNASAEKLIGWPFSVAEGKDFGEVFRVFDENSHLELPNPFVLVSSSMKVNRFPSNTALKNHLGREISISGSAAPIRAKGGTLLGVVIVFRDITEQRLLEKQLRQAERMQAIGQLAGGVAHDFNNQITGIMGCAEMLKMLVKDEKPRRYVNMMLTAAGRSADLTSKLLAFARRGTYQSVPLDVHKVIGEVIALLEHTIDKRIRLREEFFAPQSVIIGDPTQLQNALLNIGINSRDALPEGGDIIFSTKTVELSQESVDRFTDVGAPGRYIEISVTDNGIGMSDEVQAHLFEPFFTTKKEGKGTGMGLAAVYGTVKSHKGGITVESALGKGSVFRIFLPLAEEDEKGKAETTSVALAKESARILVIDDEEIVRQVAADMLKSLGYEVVMCGDGKHAIETYRAQWMEIDLVMLDMVMPGLSGRDTFGALKEINPEVKVIMFSGFSLNRSVQDVIDRGAVGFLQKPFLLSELAKKVADVVK